MLHGGRSRTAAHRAPGPWSPLLRTGLFLRTGRHGPHPLCQVQQAPQLMLSGLAAMILAAIVGLVCFVVVAEHRRAPSVRQSSALPFPAGLASFPAGLASRAADPEPLTQPEVFPAAEVRPSPGARPYRLTVTNRERDCGTATGGELGPLLRDLGCSQVVRAGTIAPYGGYRVTLGVFNLPDGDGARAAAEGAGLLGDRGRGTFAALGAPSGQASWQPWGHYLLYCVVSRPDGKVVADDDPYATRITTELVEHYLAGTVLAERSGNP